MTVNLCPCRVLKCPTFHLSPNVTLSHNQLRRSYDNDKGQSEPDYYTRGKGSPRT